MSDFLSHSDYAMMAEAIEPLTNEFPYATARRHEGEGYSQSEWLKGLFAMSALKEYYSDLDPDALSKALRRAYRLIPVTLH
jgi:hypothetical protein